MEKINIYGASGHAKVVIDALESLPNRKIGYIYDDDPGINSLLDFPVQSFMDPAALKDNPWVIAIGNNRIRKKISLSIESAFSNCISHKTAVISSSARIGEGSVIFANAVLNASTTIGKHCILNTGSVVEHDCRLSDFVHISPKAAIAGGVQVGEGTHIGIGAVVIPGIKIGEWCTIGAGAVIIEDVPSFSTVVGNPGRAIKRNHSPVLEGK